MQNLWEGWLNNEEEIESDLISYILKVSLNVDR